jgi:serine protease Do
MLGLVLGVAAILNTHSAGPVQAQTPLQEQALANARDLSTAFEYVAETIQPSVVSIASTKRVSGNRRWGGVNPFGDGPGNDFFERFFGSPPEGRDYESRGQGTGVIVSSEGHILTNNHVVDGAEEVVVQLHDDREFKASVVGVDPKTDLAVLRIEAGDLVAARLGDSDALKIGEWVVAAGNPFGLSSSISAGIVSAKGRSNVRIAEYEDFIQTDAAINPGNSGGPLVNLRGEVVGINTAIYTRSGGYMGIGFAIPVNMAKSIMSSLIEEGRVVRGWLGVQIQDLTPDLASSFGYEGTDGVLVTQVMEDTPAQKAGMQAEDIIRRFDDQPVANVTELRSQVAATRPGSVADVEVHRKGRSKTLHVSIGELDGGEDGGKPKAVPAVLDMGLSIRTLTPDVARRAGFDDEFEGVLVTGVEPLSPASRAGLRRGDVILAVQGKEVSSAEQFETVMKKADLEEGVRLHVRRGDGKLFFVVKAEEGDLRG